METRHPSALARVCCIYVVGLSSLWFTLVDRACSWLFFLGKDTLYKKVVGFLPLCRRVSQDVDVILRGGMSRLLWLGGNGATSPVEKRE